MGRAPAAVVGPESIGGIRVPEMTIREAIALGLREALDSDETTFLMGENIGAYGGAYGVTEGLLDRYGPQRVRDAPISEAAIAGAAIGAAMGGMRPIVEMMTINFALLAMDQVVNHAAKIRYVSNGRLQAPMVIRTVTGGAQMGASHSQSLEGWFASVPGLKVAAPSTPHDALGLLRAAVREAGPVLYAEHALLYEARGDVPDDWYEVPLGKADVRRSGSDVTLVAHSRMVQVALEAARELEAAGGLQAEVVDLRTLCPLDMDTILESVRKTGRAVIVEERWRTGGFAGEIASAVQEAAFDQLDGPVARVAGADVPAPYAADLEAAALPGPGDVLRAIERTFGIFRSTNDSSLV